MKYFVILIVFFTHITTYGQKVTEIKGRVLDDRNMPIENVIVYLYARGMPSTYTNAKGVFTINTENMGIDIHARSYGLSFFRNGYGTIFKELEIPIKKPIVLNESNVGYIQLRKMGTNEFLTDIILRHKANPDTSDNFGIIKVVIPIGTSPNENYSVSARGGCCFHDTTITFKYERFNEEIVPIFLRPKKIGYDELTEAFNEALDKYYKGLINSDPDKRKASISSCEDIFYEIQNFTSLTKKQRYDYNQRVNYMREIIEELVSIELNMDKIDVLERKHKLSVDEFMEDINDYYSAPPSIPQIPYRMERLISKGLVTLRRAVELAEFAKPYSYELVIHDAEQILKLIEHIESIELPRDYPNRKELQKRLNGIVLKNTNAIESILMSIKKQ